MAESALNYLAPMTERPAYYLYPPPDGKPWRNTRGDRRIVPIHDARKLPEAPTLDREGFALVAHKTGVADLYDAPDVRRRYYPEIEDLVKRVTGAPYVLAFDHNVRSAELAERSESGAQHPVRFAHNDYTERSGPQRVRDLVPEVAEELLQGRVAVINVWKPIRGPVLANPLVFCDARSLPQSDLIPTDLIYRDRSGEVYSLVFGPSHRWYYFPRMRANEALLLKCFDSASGVARFTAHSAIDDATTPPDAPARESIEVRTLAFFPDG